MKTQRPISLPWLAVLLLAAVALTGAGCMPGNSEASEPPVADVDGEDAQDDRIAVAAIPLTRGPIEAVLRFSANLEAEESVEVFSEASRRVTRLRVEEGDRVRKGDLLLQLEDDEQRSALAKVESQLERARREYERQKSLYDQALISEQAFTEATYELEQLEIALDDARRELSYTEVRAPISGVVTQRMVSVGDFVQSQDRLFEIVDFDSIVALIYVPESELPSLRVGQSARLSAQATGGKEHEAVIDRISPVVDPKTGTVKVTLAVPAGEGVVPGMYVEVDLVTDVRNEALLIPKRALVYDQDQVFVFRVNDDQAVERVRVEPVLEERNFVTVDEGLAAGDRIVVAGQAGLKNGTEVRLLDLEEALATFGDGQFGDT